MEDATAPYNAVYHFRDEHLFEAFAAQIPRPQLLEHARKNEPLKNRCFSGFRLTTSFPTHRQILAAYKKEIVDRHGGKLASALCADWIAHQQELTSKALESIDIHVSTPSDAHSWIRQVQAKLDAEPHEDIFRRLVQSLVGQFSNDDIHIFASVISYGKDQQRLRDLVEQELLGAEANPSIQKKRIEADLKVATERIGQLKKLEGELKSQRQGELDKADKAFESLLKGHDELLKGIAEDDTSIAALTNSLEDIKKQLIEQQRARDAKQKQEHKLSQDIKRQRKYERRCKTRPQCAA